MTKSQYTIKYDFSSLVLVMLTLIWAPWSLTRDKDDRDSVCQNDTKKSQTDAHRIELKSHF